MTKKTTINKNILPASAMTPELSPMENTHDMWKRRLGPIIKMTSGVVYSIVMHSLLITAYALLIFQILYTNEFDLNMFFSVTGFTIFYLIFVVVEVAMRCSCEDPLLVTKSGHVAHMYGSIILTAYMDPSNPIEYFPVGLLLLWTPFVLAAYFIPAYIAFQQDHSLTEPLV